MVVEVEGTDDPSIMDGVIEGATVYGPSREAARIRWIVQDHDLWGVKERFAGHGRPLRDQGCKVRVDVDPREF